MPRYRKVSILIWNDEKFSSLSDDGKLMFLFLLTHPHMTSLGAMRATAGGLAAELGWTHHRFTKAFGEAFRKGIVEGDPDASYIGLPNFIKHNPPESPNVLKAWVKSIDLIPECSRKVALLQRVKGFVEGLSKGFREAFAEAWPLVSPNPEQEQEQEQEPEQNKNPQTLFGNEPPQPKKKRKPTPAVTDDRFSEFWELACRKKVVARARKWWAKAIKLAPPDSILASWRKWNEYWRSLPDEKREFIVYPSKWLEDKSWEDEVPEANGLGESEDPINRIAFGKVKIRVLRGEHEGWTGFACGCHGSMLNLPNGLEVKFDDVEIVERNA